MYSSALPNRICQATIFLGCVLAAWPLDSASAQVSPEVAATPRGSQLEALAVRDWPDESKAGAPAPDHGAATIPNMTPAASREFAQQYITEKLALWQQRLKLGDWHITWAMARRSDLKPNTVGQIHWDKPNKSAAILVMDPSDYRMPFSAMLDDMELTIIHEVVHLKLTSLPHSEASRGSEEQAVNGLSEALFALEHQKQ